MREIKLVFRVDLAKCSILFLAALKVNLEKKLLLKLFFNL